MVNGKSLGLVDRLKAGDATFANRLVIRLFGERVIFVMVVRRGLFFHYMILFNIATSRRRTIMVFLNLFFLIQNGRSCCASVFIVTENRIFNKRSRLGK